MSSSGQNTDSTSPTDGLEQLVNRVLAFGYVAIASPHQDHALDSMVAMSVPFGHEAVTAAVARNEKLIECYEMVKKEENHRLLAQYSMIAHAQSLLVKALFNPDLPRSELANYPETSLDSGTFRKIIAENNTHGAVTRILDQAPKVIADLAGGNIGRGLRDFVEMSVWIEMFFDHEMEKASQREQPGQSEPTKQNEEYKICQPMKIVFPTKTNLSEEGQQSASAHPPEDARPSENAEFRTLIDVLMMFDSLSRAGQAEEDNQAKEDGPAGEEVPLEEDTADTIAAGQQGWRYCTIM